VALSNIAPHRARRLLTLDVVPVSKKKDRAWFVFRQMGKFDFPTLCQR
jgi:hypothetical protein